MEVQPYYVIDEQRKSTQTELNTIERIKDEIEKLDPAARMLIKDHILINKKDIPENHIINKKFNNLTEEAFMGGQHNWLARMADYYNLYGLELGVHSDDNSAFFLKNNVIKETHNGISYYKINNVDLDNPLSLFKYYHFPLLDYTKLEMKEQSEKDGFDHIMEMTWFCFNPTKNGEPCGLCNPCKYTKGEGLGRRVPRPRMSTLVNHYFKKITQKFKLFVKKSLKIK